MRIFEFSQSWNTTYFIGMLCIAFSVTILCKKAIAAKSRNRKHKRYLVFAFLILFLVGTLRSVNVGTDTLHYYGYLSDLHKYGIDVIYGYYKWEPLFSIYMYLVSRVTGCVNILFALNSAFTSYCLLKYISTTWRNSDSFVFIPLFIIQYQYGLSSMRSSIAVGFILLSILSLKENKLLKSMILSVVAALFHFTAVFEVLFILYIIIVKKILFGSRKPFILISSITYFMLAYVFAIRFHGLFDGTKYEYFVYNHNSNWLGRWNIILAALISLYLINKSRGKNLFDRNIDEVINIIVVSCLPLYVLMNIYRVPTYYLLPRCSTYSKACKIFEIGIDRSNYMFVKVVEVIIMMFGMLFYASRIDTGMFYQFFWQV